MIYSSRPHSLSSSGFLVLKAHIVVIAKTNSPQQQCSLHFRTPLSLCLILCLTLSSSYWQFHLSNQTIRKTLSILLPQDSRFSSEPALQALEMATLTMNPPTRQPLGAVGGARLRNLGCVKNTQNGESFHVRWFMWRLFRTADGIINTINSSYKHNSKVRDHRHPRANIKTSSYSRLSTLQTQDFFSTTAHLRRH